MRRLFVLAVAPLALLSPQAADAAGGTVQTSASGVARELDHGYLVVVECEALATGATPTTVAIQTTVVCTLNGRTVTESYYGPMAATTMTAALTAPATFCWGGSAVFVDVRTATSATVVAPVRCSTVPPTG